jgi:hypothetical protein
MFKVRQKVRFIDENGHERTPEFCPYVGNIGTIMAVDDVEDMALVEWGADSGVWQRGDGGRSWWCMNRMLEAVDGN